VNDNCRVQLDIRDLPLGIKPKLKQMALDADLTLTEYIKAALIDLAKSDEEFAASQRPGYTPVR
jgi:hypothetical protein